MATGTEVETLTGSLARETPKRDREQAKTGLTTLGNALSSLMATKTLLDTVVADAATAGDEEYGLTQVQSDWAANLVAALTAWEYDAKSGVPALAQLIADLSEQAGLEGGASRMRLFTGQPGSETIVPVDQDA